MATSERKQVNKFPALTTYVIALVCLIAGLFVPLFNGDGILAFQLPDALNVLVGKEILTFGNDFTLSYPVSLFGLEAATFDLAAAAVLLYALITVLGIIALIPVIASKRTTKTAYVFASIIEVAAVVVLTVYVLAAITLQINYNTINNSPDGDGGTVVNIANAEFSYNMLIPFGGALLMLILQTFIYRKGSGAMKFFLFLFSAVSAFALFDVVTLIPALNDPLTDVAGLAGFSPLFFGISGASASGINYARTLIESNIVDAFKIFDTAAQQCLFVCSVALATLVIVNLILDTIALATKSCKGSRVINLIRYSLEVALVICIIVTLLVSKDADYEIGLMLLIIALMAIIQLVMSVIRYCVAAKKSGVKLEKSKKNSKLYKDVPDPVPAAQNIDTSYYAPATPVAPVAAEEAKPVTKIYAVNIYQGPTDDFIKKLNNEEKIEFSRLFIEKNKGDVSNIPDYVIGGDNKKFFSSVFIYLGRLRNEISNGLLNAMYKELNLL